MCPTVLSCLDVSKVKQGSESSTQLLVWCHLIRFLYSIYFQNFVQFTLQIPAVALQPRGVKSLAISTSLFTTEM